MNNTESYLIKANGKIVLTAKGTVIARCSSAAWAQNIVKAVNAYVTSYEIACDVETFDPGLGHPTVECLR